MGILSRFTDIMKANTQDRLKKSADPLKTLDDILRELKRDVGSLKAEAAAILAEEERAKRYLGECKAEISKLERYAAKAAESGDDEAALRFLEKKEQQSGRWNELQTAYRQASSNADKINQLAAKLAQDISGLSARRDDLTASDRLTGFDEREEQAKLALYEAEALAELQALRSGSNPDSLDKEFAELERELAERGQPGQQSSAGPRQELEDLKARLNENKQ